jgi:hypothetical protein
LPCSISQTPSASMKVDLPAPGHAGDADADRLAGARQQRVEHLLRALLVIGARRLDQRDRLGQRPALAGEHAVDQLTGRHRTGDWPARALRPVSSASTT